MSGADKGRDVRYQAVLQLLRTSDTIWNASRRFFERWDIGPSQFNVLNLLASEKDGLSQVELSRQLIMHRSNVTGLVDRLEKRGLVERRDQASDRRAYRVMLTASGRSLLEQILPEYYRGASGIWAGLSTQRVGALARDLQCAAENAMELITRKPTTIR
jgi:DNA-binding MarR family transcriptional regulator